MVTRGIENQSGILKKGNCRSSICGFSPESYLLIYRSGRSSDLPLWSTPSHPAGAEQWIFADNNCRLRGVGLQLRG